MFLLFEFNFFEGLKFKNLKRFKIYGVEKIFFFRSSIFVESELRLFKFLFRIKIMRF